MRRASSFLAITLAGALVAGPMAMAEDAPDEEGDKGWLTSLIEDNLSGAGRKVTITGFAGALSSRATMQRLTIADEDGVWITLDDIVLDWSRSALLRGNLIVNELGAAAITIDRLPRTEEAPVKPEATPFEFALPELPVSVDIGSVRADRITLGPSILGEPFEGTLGASLHLAGGDGTADVRLERTGDAPAGLIRLDASYSNSSRHLKIDFEASEDKGGIVARALDLPGAPEAGLSLIGDGTLDSFDAILRLESDGEERLAGPITLRDEASGARGFSARLRGNPAPLFLPDYAEFLGDRLTVDVTGRTYPDGALELDTLALQSRALMLDGEIRLGADRLPERLDVTATIAREDGAPVLLPIAGPERTHVRHADLDLQFDRRAGSGWQLAAHVQGLDRPDLQMADVTLRGRGRMGRLQDARDVGGTLHVDAAGVDGLDPALLAALGTDFSAASVFSWREAAGALDLSRLSVRGTDYGLWASLAIRGLGEGLRTRGRARISADDLSRFSALAGRPLAGRVTGVLRGEGSALSGAFDLAADIDADGLAIDQPEVDHLFAGHSVISTHVVRDETGTRIDAFDARARSLNITAHGRLSSSGHDLRGRLAWGDLADLGAPWGGAVNAEVSFAGLPGEATITFDGSTDALRIGQPEADRLLAGHSTITARVAHQGGAFVLERAHVDARSLSLDASGRLDPVAGHDVTATLDWGTLGDLGGGFGGRLRAEAGFAGTPDEGRLTLSGTGDGLRIGQPEADKLIGDRAELAVAAQLDAGAFRLERATISTSELDANVRGASPEGALDVTGRLRNLALLVPQFPGPVTLTGSLRPEGEGYATDLHIGGPAAIDARIAGRMAARAPDLRISGRANAALANGPIAPVTMSGGLSYDLRIGGWGLDGIGGRVSLADARLAVPVRGIALDDLNASVDLANGVARLAASAASPLGGTLRLEGPVTLSNRFPAALDLGINGLRLRDPELYDTSLDGRIGLNGALLGNATLAGRITLGETEIRVPSSGFASGADLDSIRHVGDSRDVRATRERAGVRPRQRPGGQAPAPTGGGLPPWPLDLDIRAPARIFIRGRGLDAELGGAAHLGGTLRDPIPSGGLNLVRGRLDILGKRLDLSEATLMLEGGFTPWLLVAASNTTDGVTSTITVEGPADEPEVTFSSEPEMPEEEVLAWLLFGRGLDTISAFQAVQLASAVATLAGRGGEGIVGKLRQGFGFDDLDIATEDDGAASVKAGKYISDNVYTEVGVDQTGNTRINLNLDLKPGVTLRGRADSDGASGIGIFLEKDY